MNRGAPFNKKDNISSSYFCRDNFSFQRVAAAFNCDDILADV